METNFPTVSIVWVSWAMNEERQRLACLSLDTLIASVEHLPVEVIVVENGTSHFVGVKGVSTYISNAENRHFGYARNQGLREASGDYLAVSDNDITYKRGWLEACVQALIEYPDQKIIASPLEYPKINGELHGNPLWRLPPLGGYKRHQRAGSNSWVMRRETWEECGLFKHHRIAGSLFTDSLVRHGYCTMIVGEGLAEDGGLRKGYNISEEIKVAKNLLDGTEIVL